MLDDEDFFDRKISKRVRYLTNEDSLYGNLSVAENITFLGRNRTFYNKKNNENVLKNLNDETGFYVKANDKVENLTSERKKVVEVLKCYYANPRFFIVREAAGMLSHSNFVLFLNLLEKMKRKGTKILYITSQWEEAIKVGDRVTLVVHNENFGVYPIEEIKNDPSQIYQLMMGRRSYEQEVESSGGNESEILRRLSENIKLLSNDYDVKKTLQTFSKYLVKELKASSCIMYLINEKKSELIEVAVQTNIDTEINTPRLKMDILQFVKQQKELTYLTENDYEFWNYFEKKPNVKTVMVYPVIMGINISALIQVNYDNVYVYTERDSIVLKWVAQEMAIVLENSRLMGNSVLLQESHHRIKNNLQIIISLVELEKEMLINKIKDNYELEIIQGIFDGISSRIKSIARVHDLLSSENVINSVIDMYIIINEICKFYSNSADIELDFDEIFVPYAKAISIALVTSEIISNSIKHNSGKRVKIIITAKEDKSNQEIYLSYQDNGIGLREKNGVHNEDNDGVGMVMLRTIVCIEFHGTIDMYNNNGARVDLKIPTDSFILPI